MKKAQKAAIAKFQKMIWAFSKLGRREMPWRSEAGTKAALNPYFIMVSEIMLQQTQVARVMKKYPLFIERFPTIKALAEAPVSSLLKEWQGMGYNRRALFLKRAAEEIQFRRKGEFPKTTSELEELPGIGPATAAAIYVYSWNKPAPFIETNIRRVFLHHFFAKSERIADKELMPFIEAALDMKNPREWHYALMDYGTWLKSEVDNPNRRSRHYTKQSRFEGSNRQVRSRILKLILKEGAMKKDTLIKALDPKGTDNRVAECLVALEKEGFIGYDGETIKPA